MKTTISSPFHPAKRLGLLSLEQIEECYWEIVNQVKGANTVYLHAEDMDRLRRALQPYGTIGNPDKIVFAGLSFITCNQVELGTVDVGNEPVNA